METNDKTLIAELRRDEGVRYSPYLDTVGIPTIGVGHNMKAHPLPKDWKTPLTDAQVNQLLAEDLKEVFDGLDAKLPWWRTLSYSRQRVLANMAFNMGLKGLLSFNNTLAAIKAGNYDRAAENMLASKWAGQVKARAVRLADMMKKG